MCPLYLNFIRFFFQKIICTQYIQNGSLSYQICRGIGGNEGQGGGIADKPSASVVSELQHKLLKHCRRNTILTSESD